MPDEHGSSRPGRSVWPLVLFLVGFIALIWIVSEYFLIPAMTVAKEATREQKKQLVAHSRLLMAVVLFILCVGLLMLFRIRRFFFPRSLGTRTKTEYIDAWAESAKRLKDDEA
jgi:hypothetical protein